jgi:predicted HicB family RNase H-like nuclease
MEAPTMPSTEKEPVIDKKILDAINIGGKPIQEPNGRGYKNFNIRIFDDEMARINALRALRPRPRRGVRLGISLQDWIIEALEEKMQREEKKLK